jgi:hypothetical protein
MTENLVFTRYLYNKELVLESLENAILEALYDESLFWAYELYFSGFETETFQKCFAVFHNYYNNYKKLEKFFLKKEREWTLSQATGSKKDEILAIFVKNMCMRKRDLNKEEPKREMYVIVDSNQIDPFRTREIKPAWKTLPLVCKYDLRISGKEDEDVDNHLELLREQWLFHASYSPIWKTRILEHGGEIDCTKKRVFFTSDESYEVFYESYGFEPDEQKLQIQKRCLGI